MARRDGWRDRAWVVAPLALVAVAIAYLPSFAIPFLFDDHFAILENPTLREGPFSAAAWRPPGGEEGTTVQGRPLLNASFAANHAIGGLDPLSYHAVNLAIHLANTLLLALLLAMLFRSPRWAPWFAERGDWIAVAVATLWALHPLQVLSVSYVAQRAESLVSFWYLATLAAWCAARLHPRRARILVAISVACGALGMATKEVMATAPLVLLLLDRLLFAVPDEPTPPALRWGRVGILATWGVLVVLLAEQGFARGRTTGTELMSRSAYLTTQAYAIPLYVARILWPVGVTFDHGPRIVDDAPRLLLAAAGWLAMLAPFAWLLARGHGRAAAALTAFFVLLAPTSSVVPIATQTIAEHRVYLASAVVLAGVVVAAARLAQHFARERLAAAVALAIAALLGLATFRLNRELQDEQQLWTRVARQVPTNWRAFNSLGRIALARGDLRAALAAFDRVLALHPAQIRARYNRGNVRARIGDWSGAADDYRLVLQEEPEHVWARNNLAMVLLRTGQRDAARAELERAVTSDPGHATAWYNLALVELQSGDASASLAAVERYLALRPDAAKGWRLAADAQHSLGNSAAARDARARAQALESAARAGSP